MTSRKRFCRSRLSTSAQQLRMLRNSCKLILFDFIKYFKRKNYKAYLIYPVVLGQQIVQYFRRCLARKLLLLLGNPLGAVNEQIELLVRYLVEEIGTCGTNAA